MCHTSRPHCSCFHAWLILGYLSLAAASAKCSLSRHPCSGSELSCHSHIPPVPESWAALLSHTTAPSVGRTLAAAAAASSQLCCSASGGIGSCCQVPALGVTGQEAGETSFAWAMLDAEQPHLHWGKGSGLDRSLQQAGFDDPGHPRLDFSSLYLLCFAQTLEWIQDSLCPHELFSGPQHCCVWLLKQEKLKVRLHGQHSRQHFWTLCAWLYNPTALAI